MAQSPQAESNFLPHHEVKRPIDPASGNHSQPTQPPAGGTVVQNTDHQGDRTSCTQDGLSLKPEKTSFDRASAQLDNDRSELSKEQPNAKYPWIRLFPPPRTVNASVAREALEELSNRLGDEVD